MSVKSEGSENEPQLNNFAAWTVPCSASCSETVQFAFTQNSADTTQLIIASWYSSGAYMGPTETLQRAWDLCW